jgi:hypothetical protein
MNANEWLKNELETAAAEHHAAYVTFSNLFPGAERDAAKATMDYWNGYANAITNALNELAGPGDTN